MYILVFLSFLVMLLLVWGFASRPVAKDAYVLVVHYRGTQVSDKILRYFQPKHRIRVRSKVFRGDQVEETFQFVANSQDLTFTEKIRELEEVSDMTLLKFDGEYHG